MSVYENMAFSHCEYCKERISRLEKQVEQYPPGQLHCYKNHNSFRYVLHNDKEKPAVISPKLIPYIQKMAYKTFLLAALDDLRAEEKIARGFLKLLKRHPHAREQFLKNPGLTRHLSAVYPDADLQAWANAPYKSNPLYPEQKNVPTEAGIMVRSKSEAIIVSVLLMLGIPFRYEEELRIGNSVFYPDFTILHPRTHKRVIIEHFGMMDDPAYARDAALKIQKYIVNGYIPEDTLLFFFESQNRPLNIVHVRTTFMNFLQ